MFGSVSGPRTHVALPKVLAATSPVTFVGVGRSPVVGDLEAPAAVQTWVGDSLAFAGRSHGRERGQCQERNLEAHGVEESWERWYMTKSCWRPGDVNKRSKSKRSAVG